MIYCMGIILISVLVRGFYIVLNNPKSPEKGKVYLPKIFCILGIVCSVIALLPAIITLVGDYELWVVIVYFIFSLLGVVLIIAFCNCRITYDEQHFVVKNFFGVKRSFTYDEVVSIRENMHETFLYTSKCKVMVDEYSIGGTEFLTYVKKRYRQSHNGQSLPKIYKTKHDIFNGNVYDAGGFVFAYILMFIVLLGSLVAFINYIYFSPSNADNTIKQTICFDSYESTDSTIVLKSSNNLIYNISYNEEEFDADAIKNICDGESYVTVYSKMITPDDEEDYYSVQAIACGDIFLLSFEQTNRWHIQESWFIIVFISVVLCLWVIYVVFSIVVGRNPQKYGRKIIKLFFQDGYVRY